MESIDLSSMSTVQQVVLAQAIINKLNDTAGTKAGPRREVDAFYKNLFMETGAKTMDLRFAGEKVGTYTIKTTKGEPDQIESSFVVTDESALRADDDEDFAEYLVETWIPSHLAQAAEDFFYEVGSLLDGCKIEERVIPGSKEGQYIGGALSVKEPDVVIDAALGASAREVMGYLTGEE